MKIAIDVGHANGTGAQGNGLEEHAQCAEIAKLLKCELCQQGYTAVIVDFADMSNRDDLNKSISYINQINCDLCISLHCDCSSNEYAHGAHVCYVSKGGEKLAQAIANHLCKLLPGRANKIDLRTNLAILNKTKPITVLCECGFISNREDASIIKNDKPSIAQCIANGVIDYVG